jgi:hypothetical protein
MPLMDYASKGIQRETDNSLQWLIWLSAINRKLQEISHTEGFIKLTINFLNYSARCNIAPKHFLDSRENFNLNLKNGGVFKTIAKINFVFLRKLLAKI